MTAKIIGAALLLQVSLVALAQEREGDSWTLQECLDHALDHNLDIKRNELAVARGEVNLSESKAARYPTLNAGGSSGFRWGRSIDPVSNLFVTRRIGSMGLSAGSSATLFSGMQINNSIARDKLDLSAARYDLQSAKDQLALDVASYFLEVVFSRELVKNAERQLEVTEAQLDKTRKLVDAGSAPISDQLVQEAEKFSQEAALVEAQNALDLALLNLKQLLRIPGDQPFSIEIPDIEVEEGVLEEHSSSEIYETALVTQPMIKSADIRRRSGDLGVKIARGGYYPRLSINGEVFTNYSDVAEGPRIPDGTFTETTEVIGFITSDPSQTISATIATPNYTSDPNYTIGEQFSDNLSQSAYVQLSIPIFNGLSVRSNVQRAIIAQEEAEIAFEESRQLLRQNIESAYNEAAAASKSYQASTKRVEALEESFRAVERRYNLGATDFVEYQTSQNNLFNANYEALRSKYEYIFRTKVLEFYLGNPLSF